MSLCWNLRHLCNFHSGQSSQGNDGWGLSVQFLVGERYFSLLRSIWVDSGIHPACFWMCTGGLFTPVSGLRDWSMGADHSHPSRAGIVSTLFHTSSWNTGRSWPVLPYQEYDYTAYVNFWDGHDRIITSYWVLKFCVVKDHQIAHSLRDYWVFGIFPPSVILKNTAVWQVDLFQSSYDGV